MEAKSVAGVILAAGKGTRMKSDLPKGLHRICGLPMVEIVGRALKSVGVERPIVVVGHGGEAVMEALGAGYQYVWQREQLGTGHAAMMAAELLKDHDGPVIVGFADTPLVDASVFQNLLDTHLETGSFCTFTSAILDNPFGYGRVIKNASGDPVRIIEEKDCSADEKLIPQVHAGIHCFDCKTFLETLPKLSPVNAQNEYYLTDMITHIAAAGKKVVAKVYDDPAILTGVNDRWQLALADKELRRRTIKRLALEGVTFMDVDSVYIGLDVEIGNDTTIWPGTVLLGKTRIGRSSSIGPNSRIMDTEIGDDTTVVMSYMERAKVGNGVWVGPFAHLRPRAVVGDRCKIGNFVEVKNSTLGDEAKVSHLTYIGDAEIGADANIGAGTITCNYDGYAKNRTTIGAKAFVGSNTTLVAPLTIGEGAMIAAGSVITHDVPADSLALGRARQENKEGWMEKWRRLKQSKGH